MVGIVKCLPSKCEGPSSNLVLQTHTHRHERENENSGLEKCQDFAKAYRLFSDRCYGDHILSHAGATLEGGGRSSWE
jgi:hypothetical protein